MELEDFNTIMNKVVNDNYLTEKKFHELEKTLNTTENIEEKIKLMDEFLS